MSSPHRRLAIGVGNPDRGDDAVGIHVIRACASHLPEGVAAAESAGDPSHLLSLWSQSETAILIDAAATGSPPGTVLRFDASREPLPSSLHHHSTHGFGIAEAIELGRSLRALPPCVIVFAIEGSQFEPGVGLSPDVQAAVPRVAEMVLRELSVARRSPR